MFHYGCKESFNDEEFHNLDKNALLVLHAVVTGVIFYIGTSVITPYTDFYMQGFKTNKGKKNKAVKPVKKIGRVPRPSNI